MTTTTTATTAGHEDTTKAATATRDTVAPAKNRSMGRRPLLIGAAAAVVLASGAYWSYERQFEDTDDAQIDSDISSVSPRVSGNVIAVNVVENQVVKAGDVLAEIDPKDLEVALVLAKAQVSAAEAQRDVEHPSVHITETSNKSSVDSTSSDLSSAQAAVSQAKKVVAQTAAQLAQAQANDKNVQIEKKRSDQLLAQGATTQQDVDQRTSVAAASSANIEALRQATQAAEDQVREAEAHLAATQSRLTEVQANAPRQLATRQASVIWREAQLEAQKAELDQAQLNLSYAKIVAPVSGIVGKKTVALGDHVAPGQELMAIAKSDDVWVTANFRETQLTRMHPGLSVTVYVDAIDASLHGVVESIGGATGSRFSVLPPENASGNYVKVVQRIPVRIHLDTGQPGMDRLRPGMSVEPKVRL